MVQATAMVSQSHYLTICCNKHIILLMHILETVTSMTQVILLENLFTLSVDKLIQLSIHHCKRLKEISSKIIIPMYLTTPLILVMSLNGVDLVML